MNNDKSFSFTQRWRKLVALSKDLDWNKSAFAKDLRDELPAGATGDKALTKWCEVELAMPAYVSAELLLRASVAALVDKKGYEAIGGFSAVRQIVYLEKKQQIRAIESAKALGKSVRSVMRDMDLLPEPVTVEQDLDAAMLAAFIVARDLKLPAPIAKIVAKYTRKQRHLKAVA